MLNITSNSKLMVCFFFFSFLAEWCWAWTNRRVAPPGFLTCYRGAVLQSSLWELHRHHQRWPGLIVAVVTTTPFLMSTKALTTDKSAYLDAADQNVLFYREEKSIHTTAHKVFWILEGKKLARPAADKFKLNWMNFQAKNLASLFLKLIFLGSLSHCCVTLCSVAVRHSCGLNIWWFIYVM